MTSTRVKVMIASVLAGATLLIAATSQAGWCGKYCAWEEYCFCGDRLPRVTGRGYTHSGNKRVQLYLIDGTLAAIYGLDANGSQVVSCEARDSTPNAGWVYDTTGCGRAVRVYTKATW